MIQRIDHETMHAVEDRLVEILYPVETWLLTETRADLARMGEIIAGRGPLKVAPDQAGREPLMLLWRAEVVGRVFALARALHGGELPRLPVTGLLSAALVLVVHEDVRWSVQVGGAGSDPELAFVEATLRRVLAETRRQIEENLARFHIVPRAALVVGEA